MLIITLNNNLKKATFLLGIFLFPIMKKMKTFLGRGKDMTPIPQEDCRFTKTERALYSYTLLDVKACKEETMSKAWSKPRKRVPTALGWLKLPEGLAISSSSCAGLHRGLPNPGRAALQGACLEAPPAESESPASVPVSGSGSGKRESAQTDTPFGKTAPSVRSVSFFIAVLFEA